MGSNGSMGHFSGSRSTAIVGRNDLLMDDELDLEVLGAIKADEEQVIVVKGEGNNEGGNIVQGTGGYGQVAIPGSNQFPRDLNACWEEIIRLQDTVEAQGRQIQDLNSIVVQLMARQSTGSARNVVNCGRSSSGNDGTSSGGIQTAVCFLN